MLEQELAIDHRERGRRRLQSSVGGKLERRRRLGAPPSRASASPRTTSCCGLVSTIRGPGSDSSTSTFRCAAWALTGSVLRFAARGLARSRSRLAGSAFRDGGDARRCSSVSRAARSSSGSLGRAQRLAQRERRRAGALDRHPIAHRRRRAAAMIASSLVVSLDARRRAAASRLALLAAQHARLAPGRRELSRQDARAAARRSSATVAELSARLDEREAAAADQDQPDAGRSRPETSPERREQPAHQLAEHQTDVAPRRRRPNTSSSGAATRTSAESTIATIRSPNSRCPTAPPARPRRSGAPISASSSGTSQATSPKP